MDEDLDSAEYRGFSVPYGTKNLRIETTSSTETLVGKLRVTCQDVQAQMDLGSVERSKNTLLDFREDEFTEKNVIYIVPDIDESANSNFGALSFFESKRDARFKANCGFGQNILSSYEKIKSG